MKIALSYDDVLLVPQYSEIESRKKDVSLVVDIGKFQFSHPIIPANMKTVAGITLLKNSIARGGLSILNRIDSSLDVQCDQIKTLKFYFGDTTTSSFLAPSIGVKDSDLENAKVFADMGCKIICVDIAHGHSKHCLDMCGKVSKLFDLVIAGNVATARGARQLWDSGASVVKCGIGSGRICTTRMETGNGVPQLSAIMDVASVRRRGEYLIADGGIVHTKDCVLALCFADMVMAGGMFAATEEAPGNIVEINGVMHKEYKGSSTYKTSHKEGVEALVPVTGTFEAVLRRALEGIRSGCSYQGVTNLVDLKDSPELVQITHAGRIESGPHNVLISSVQA